jgi:hypothetical protein
MDRHIVASYNCPLLNLEKLVEHSRLQGLLSIRDANMVMERIEQMNEELYSS